QGSLDASNYAITYNSDNLTITKAPLTVTADAASKVYGVNDSTFTFASSGYINATVDGFVIHDDASNLSGVLNRPLSLANENVGSYAITQGSLDASNYAITYNG